MTGYFYSAGNSEVDHNRRRSVPNKQNLYGHTWDLVATDLASHFYYDNDGWEHDWPIQFRIYDGDIEVARYSVELESAPSFSAYEIDPEEAA